MEENPVGEQIQPSKQNKLVYIVGGIAAVILIILTMLYVSLTRNTATQTTSQSPSETNTATASIFFSPASTMYSQKSPLSSLDVMANTGGADISGVELEMSYDPKILTNLNISAPQTGSLFGAPGEYSVVYKSVDPVKAKISYLIAISPHKTPKRGIGKIATITFTVVPGNAPSTSLTFLPGTQVTALGVKGSKLKSLLPFNLIFSSRR